jgi:hypothetical protein
MRVDCGPLDPGAVIRPEPGEWHPDRFDEEELADWRAGRNTIYQLAALTMIYSKELPSLPGSFPVSISGSASFPSPKPPKHRHLRPMPFSRSTRPAS